MRMPVCLSVYLKDIWVVSNLATTSNEAAGMFLYKSLFGNMFSLLSMFSLGAGLLGHVVSICLTL